MRAEGRIRAIGAGMNSDESGEDKAIKRAWNKEYLAALLAMGGGGERGIDFLLCANQWSLLNHELFEDGILDECLKHGHCSLCSRYRNGPLPVLDCHNCALLVLGVSIVVGGPYSSGILATGADPADGSVPFYNYRPVRCPRISLALLSLLPLLPVLSST